MRTVDVLIVGAGPAGVACAVVLHRKGHECLLMDAAEFPRDKICGGGLTPRGWKLVEELFPGLEYEHIPVSRLKLFMDGRYRGTYTIGKEIRVVRRKDFDHLLLEQYRTSGGAFLRDRLKEIREREDGRIEVTTSSGETILCRYLVGADGANSRVRKYLNPGTGPGTLILEQYLPRSGADEITFDLGRNYDHGYFYIFPNTAVDVAGYGERNAGKEKLSRTLQAFGLEETKMAGAFIPTEIDYPFHPRILLVGDAGCWCDCLSYEGIYFALATGRNAALAILDNRPFRETNKRIAQSKRHRILASHLLYNRLGLATVKLISRSQKLTERILDRYLR